jgi:tetratricopeptide (TPR) repeat protein
MQELDRLEHALDEMIQGHGSTWLIAGESGVGKTRLLDELRIRALVKGVRVLHGHGFENPNSIFEMWRAPIEALLLTTMISPIQASILKTLIPNIEALLEMPVEDLPPLSPFAQQDRLMTTIVELVARQLEPLLLILDDIQFAHADFELLHWLTKSASFIPLLLVCSYRQEEAPQLADKFIGAQVIRLGRLNTDEIMQLSTAILGEAGRRKSLQALLYRETEGNTLFLIEVLRMLAEDVGQLAQIGNRALPEHVFPVGVANVIRRRLERLSDLDRHVLKFAAVCGRLIDFRLIGHCYPDHQLIFWITHCADAGILTISEGRPEFAHDKLRAVIISSIEPELLRQFHLQAAEAIELLYPRDAHYTSMLAHHFYRAGELQRAIPYQLMEADRLITLGELNRARTLLVDFLREVEKRDLPQPDERMMHWYFLLGKTLEYGIMLVGSSEEAVGWYERSLVLSMKLDNQPMIANTLTRIAAITLQHYGGAEAVESLLLSAESIYQTLDDQHGLASIALVRANIHFMEGGFQTALTLYRHALALYTEVDDQAQVAFAQERIGAVFTGMGSYELGKLHTETALQLAREMGDRIRVVSLLNSLSVNVLLSGDTATAEQLMDECYMLAVATEQYQTMASIWNNRAEIYHQRGQYEQAIDALRESITISEGIGNRRGVAWATTNLAENELHLHHLEQGRAALIRWINLVAGLQRLGFRAGTMPTIRLAALEGHYELAAEWLGMLHVISVGEQDVNAVLAVLQATVQANLDPATYAKHFKLGTTLNIEDELPRIRAFIEQRYP